MKAPDKIRNRVFNDHLSIPFYRGCNSEEPFKINREAFAIGFQTDGRDGDDGQGVIDGFDVTCPPGTLDVEFASERIPKIELFALATLKDENKRSN